VTSADVYRERAATCLQLAQEASDDDTRSLYLTMAEAWDEFAEKTEARDNQKVT
jgi:hypothetical protein